MPGLRIQVYENQQLAHSVTCPGVVELGRQAEGEGGPYQTTQQGNRCRIVVARPDEVAVSRHYLLIEPLPMGRARLKNLSRSSPIDFLDGSQLDPGAVRELDLAVLLLVGDKRSPSSQLTKRARPFPARQRPAQRHRPGLSCTCSRVTRQRR